MSFDSCVFVLRWFVLGLTLTSARSVIVFTDRQLDFAVLEGRQPDNYLNYGIQIVHYDDIWGNDEFIQVVRLGPSLNKYRGPYRLAHTSPSLKIFIQIADAFISSFFFLAHIHSFLRAPNWAPSSNMGSSTPSTSQSHVSGVGMSNQPFQPL
jgi:hypothetical protein